VPFGEYLPFRSVFGGLSDQFDQIPRDMLPGTSTQPLTIAGISVADAICFDVAYDDVIEPQVRRGASLVVVQTSNASFFGTDQLAQQFTITRARALTTGRTLLVSSLNGITAAIDADGTVIRRAPMGVTTAMVVSAPLRNGLTPAVRWQTWLEAAPKSLWALAVLAWLRRRRQSRGRPQFRA
jgi:apolipoprotein N-acyltransferase